MIKNVVHVLTFQDLLDLIDPDRKGREEAGNSPGKQCMVTGKLMAMHFNSAKQKNE